MQMVRKTNNLNFKDKQPITPHCSDMGAPILGVGHYGGVLLGCSNFLGEVKGLE